LLSNKKFLDAIINKAIVLSLLADAYRSIPLLTKTATVEKLYKIAIKLYKIAAKRTRFCDFRIMVNLGLTLLSYGSFLVGQKKYNEAIKYLKDSIDASNKSLDIDNHLIDAWEHLAKAKIKLIEIYSLMGEEEMAEKERIELVRIVQMICNMGYERCRRLCLELQNMLKKLTILRS